MGPREGEPDVDIVLYTCTVFRATRRDFSFLSIMATSDAIAHVLVSTLNPDSSVRIAAELNLSELLKSPRKPNLVVLPLFSLDTPRKSRRSRLRNSCSLRMPSPLCDR
jgi:hypothetical protein